MTGSPLSGSPRPPECRECNCMTVRVGTSSRFECIAPTSECERGGLEVNEYGDTDEEHERAVERQSDARAERALR